MDDPTPSTPAAPRMGRPPLLKVKYGTPEALEAKINEYFAWKEEQQKPRTIAGLALYLGVDYETIRDGFQDTGSEENADFREPIKRARQRLAEAYEELLHAGKPVGAIFWLKGTGHIRDQQDIKLSLDADSWAGAMASAAALKQERRKGKPAKDGTE